MRNPVNRQHQGQQRRVFGGRKMITGNGALYGSRYHLEIPTPVADS